MKFTILVAISFGGWNAPAPDRWFGPDKLRHFFTAAFVQSMSYSTLRAADAAHKDAIIGASVVTGAVSVGKEIVDVRQRGEFSVRDLAWDVAGGASASLLLSQTRK